MLIPLIYLLLVNTITSFVTRYSNLKISPNVILKKHLQKHINDNLIRLQGKSSKSGEYYSVESAYDDEDDLFDEDEELVRDMKRNDHEWMFFDVAKISVKGGDGGDGCMAMRREFRLDQGGPSGGNGGHGGSVYLVCDDTINTLAPLRRRVHHKAGDGTNGKGDSRHGRKGDDVYIPVPPGTIVRDDQGVLAGELNRPGQKLIVSRGGRGGRGNEHFKTPRMTAPAFCERGELGHERWLNVELKLVADVGFVGVPNAGKSTLLAASSNAKPKIADYPFTTIVPNLGVCDVDGTADGEGKGLVLADIPGLLEGAHDGVGLGLAFLRHIQRCKVILHVIRGDSIDPIGDFEAINQELSLFNPRLLDKPQVVVVNKIDIPEVRDKLPHLIDNLRASAGHTRVLGISAATGENVRDLMRRMRRFMDSLPVQTQLTSELFTDEEDRVDFDALEDSEFEVFTDDNYPHQFRVVGKKLERLVRMTNWDYFESLLRFQRILEAEGVVAELKSRGAIEGDLIMIDEFDFDFIDRKNRWMSELGLENVKPRRRPKAGEY